MEQIKEWFMLNPHIAIIIALVIVAIIVVKLIKKAIVSLFFVGVMIFIYLFKGSFFPGAIDGKEIISKIATQGKSYVQSGAYKDDLKKIQEKYPEVAKVIEEKAKEALAK